MVESEKGYLRGRNVLVVGLPITAVKAIKGKYSHLVDANGGSPAGTISIFNTDDFRYLSISDDLVPLVRDRLPDILVLGCYHEAGQDTGRLYSRILADLKPYHVPVLLVNAQTDLAERLRANFMDVVSDTSYFPDSHGNPPTPTNFEYLFSKLEGILGSNFSLRNRLGVIGSGNAIKDFVMGGLLRTPELGFKYLYVFNRTRKKAELIREGVRGYRQESTNPDLDVIVCDDIDDVLANTGIVLVAAGDAKMEGVGNRLALLSDYSRAVVRPLADSVQRTGFNGHVEFYSNPPELLATAFYAATGLRRISTNSSIDHIRVLNNIKEELAAKYPALGVIKDLQIDMVGLHSYGLLAAIQETAEINGINASFFKIDDFRALLTEALSRAIALPHYIRATNEGASLQSESASALTRHMLALRGVEGYEDVFAGIRVNPINYLSLEENLQHEIRRDFPNGVFLSVPARFSRTTVPQVILGRKSSAGDEVRTLRVNREDSEKLYRTILAMRGALLDKAILASVPELEQFFTTKITEEKFHKR